MKINGEFILRTIAGDSVLIPTGETALKLNGMVAVNKTAAVIWKCIQEGQSDDEIIKTILEHFEVDAETAENDFKELTKGMMEAGLLTE